MFKGVMFLSSSCSSHASTANAFLGRSCVLDPRSLMPIRVSRSGTAVRRVRPEVPYACEGGVCATCRARLVEGQVDMRLNFALEDNEVQAGYVLTCQSIPASDHIVLDFDGL